MDIFFPDQISGLGLADFVSGYAMQYHFAVKAARVFQVPAGKRISIRPKSNLLLGKGEN
jgi:hypothetical protein